MNINYYNINHAYRQEQFKLVMFLFNWLTEKNLNWLTGFQLTEPKVGIMQIVVHQYIVDVTDLTFDTASFSSMY